MVRATLKYVLGDAETLIAEVHRRCAWAAGSLLHGDGHWRSVAAAGLRLLEAGERADPELVFCFALLHDSQRVDDGEDHGHGARATGFLEVLKTEGLISLSRPRLELLNRACRDHATGATEAEPTVAVCWDADRLNLGRVGIVVSPAYLSTKAATDVETMAWVDAMCEDPPEWPELLRGYRAR